jgi:hypothetical protein
MPVLRRFLPSALAIAALGIAAALCLTAPASAAAHPSAKVRAAGLRVHLTGAALVAAADRCAAWATDAGFANDGYMAGALTTAVAVALQESGCNPAACFDNTLGKPCTEKTEVPGDSIDRGAWQLNNKVPHAASDSCAYQGPCAAKNAYVWVSKDGSYFAPWVTYSDDSYASQLWPAAQEAVNALRQGTVASAVIGTCLGFSADRRGARAETGNCGSASSQTWRVAGVTLRTQAGLCLAAASASRPADLTLARCTGSSLQAWQIRPDAELYNTGARRCLADPLPAFSGGDKPGHVLKTEACVNSQGEGWFEP